MTTLAGLTLASTIPLAGLNADITLDSIPQGSDITTNNVTSSKHGLCPKLPADATKYLDGTGAYTVPAGGGSGMVVISDQTLGAAAATIDFTSIPATYAGLLLMLSGRIDTATTSVEVALRFNNDSGANYDWEQTRAVNSLMLVSQTLADTSLDVGAVSAALAPAGTAGMFSTEIPNYAGTTFHKVATTKASSKGAAAANGLSAYQTAGWWRDTSAINRVTVVASSGNFITGTRATLYGLG